MNWAETMKHNATFAGLTHVADDESAFRRTQAASWDSFEGWLTRIKQPRNSDASSAPGGTTNGSADRGD